MYGEKDNGVPIQRTEEGLRYEKFLKVTHRLSQDMSKKGKQRWLDANKRVLERMADSERTPLEVVEYFSKMTPADVHHDNILSTMSVMYANDEFIAPRVLPIVTTNGSLGGQYWEYSRTDQTNFPDDEVGAEGTVSKLMMKRTKGSYALTPRSFKEPLDSLTVQNQSTPLNELMDIQEHVLYALDYKREERVSAFTFGAGQFGSNTTAILAGDRFDSTGGGDPAAVFDAGRRLVWNGGGQGRFVLVMGLAVYDVLKRHEQIIDKFKYTGSASGTPFANRKMLAEFFEVDDVLVGSGWSNTNNINLAPSFTRTLWGNSMALIRVASRPSLRNASFGYLLQDKATRHDMWFDGKMGAQGIYTTRATRCDAEKSIAPETGYLWTTPVNAT